MSRMRSVPLPGTRVDPLYPDSDGRPMGDTDFHTDALVWLRDALRDFYAEAPDVYVAANIVLYYQQDTPKRRRDPDVLVAKGVAGKHRRRSFRIWEEQVVPQVLFEIASRDTWRVDLHDKPAEYAALGVKEYFLYDPEGVYLAPVLQGFRTVRGQPVPLKAAADGSLVSKQLGLRLVPEGAMLRLRERQTDAPLLTRLESKEQERQLREHEQQLREQEQQRADQEHLRAERERQRADALEAELRQLRAQREDRADDDR